MNMMSPYFNFPKSLSDRNMKLHKTMLPYPNASTAYPNERQALARVDRYAFAREIRHLRIKIYCQQSGLPFSENASEPYLPAQLPQGVAL